MEKKNWLKGVKRRVLTLFLALVTVAACSVPIGAYAVDGTVYAATDTVIFVYGVEGISSVPAIVHHEVQTDLSSFFGGPPSRTGYIFDGWTLDVPLASGGSLVADDEKVPDPPDIITVWANWTPRTDSELIYDLNGGSGTLPPATALVFDQTLSYSSWLLPPTPSRPYYDFIGWANSQAQAAAYNADFAGPTGDPVVNWVGAKTVYAVWEASPVSVRFLNNYTPSDSTQYEAGNAANAGKRYNDTVSSAFAPPVRAGFAFQGWFTGRTGGVYDFSTPLTVSNLDLFALWTEKLYSVLYDMNGANSPAVAPKTGVLWAQTGLVPETEPTLAGHIFTGWDVSLGGTGTNVQSTASYGSLAADDATMALTLRAQWRKGVRIPVSDNTTINYPGPSGETPAAPTTAAPAAPAATRQAVPQAPPAGSAESEPKLDPGSDAGAEIVPIPTPHAVPQPSSGGAETGRIGSWALLNLILTIAAAAVTALLCVVLRKRRNAEAAKSGDSGQKARALTIASFIVTAAAVALCAATQNMALTMGVADQWTVWHAVLFVLQAVLAVLMKRNAAESKEEAA